LLERNPKESFPQFAGKRIRYALIVVDLGNRKPVEILHMQYSFLSFDAEGKIDPTYHIGEARVAFETFTSFDDHQNIKTVIDARRRFAKKRYRNEYLSMS
jgi:hypothetical protein